MGWLQERRRRKLLEEPFPETWDDILRQSVSHAANLDVGESARLRDFIRIFVAEKHFEGCGGFEVTDEVRVTIAARAGLLVLGLPHQYFKNVESILVYPTTVVTPERRPGAFEVPTAPMRGGVPILGEAQLHGPVLLVWDAVKQSARDPEGGHDVVYHEFAHKLDMLDGAVDGTPPLEDRESVRRWASVCEAAFTQLRERVGRGQRTFLDAYGATNEAEFFAVATEFFFDRPKAMLCHEPELYDLLRDFYQQDPAARETKGPGLPAATRAT
jgi:Mlc titration factor MtfA (ptsG expression regulator)